MRFLSSILLFILITTSNSYQDDFNKWLSNYKKYAVSQGISKKTVDQAFENTIFKKIISMIEISRSLLKTNVYIGKRVKTKVIYAKRLIKIIKIF